MNKRGAHVIHNWFQKGHKNFFIRRVICFCFLEYKQFNQIVFRLGSFCTWGPFVFASANAQNSNVTVWLCMPKTAASELNWSPGTDTSCLQGADQTRATD